MNKARWLLESPRFLIKYPKHGAHLRHVLQQIGRSVPDDVAIVPSPDDGHIGDHNLHEIFARPIRRDTIALWAAFFLGLTTVYLALNWLPSVLSLYGFSLKQASLGLAVFNLGGRFYVTDDECTHASASLADGILEGDVIECAVHLGAFHIPTGAVKAPPCSVALRTYKVVLQGDDIFANLDRDAAGEPA